jgi:peptide/nickel transport system ATP-binding protein/oligopeptide transport system ATP-binding protein
MGENGRSIVEVVGLKKYYQGPAGLFGSPADLLKAVDGVSFEIRRGETLGLVGESGCGKSTVGRSILKLIEPTGGEVRFEGRDIMRVGRRQLRNLRRDMQIVFQDPYSSLNPRMKIGQILEEPLIIHRFGSPSERRSRVAELLGLVGLSVEHRDRYPHEFSGGQRQRIGIARAIALGPKFIVCDEPVSALDVSVQAQVVNLLQDLQEQLGLTYLFISHGLPVVRHIANRIAIMYAGKLVEMAPAGESFRNPLHPYTRLLLSAVPRPDPGARPRHGVVETGQFDFGRPPAGCSFYPRCPMRRSECLDTEPEISEVSPGHFVACFAVAHIEKK